MPALSGAGWGLTQSSLFSEYFCWNLFWCYSCCPSVVCEREFFCDFLQGSLVYTCISYPNETLVVEIRGPDQCSWVGWYISWWQDQAHVFLLGPWGLPCRPSIIRLPYFSLKCDLSGSPGLFPTYRFILYHILYWGWTIYPEVQCGHIDGLWCDFTVDLSDIREELSMYVGGRFGSFCANLGLPLRVKVLALDIACTN